MTNFDRRCGAIIWVGSELRFRQCRIDVCRSAGEFLCYRHRDSHQSRITYCESCGKVVTSLQMVCLNIPYVVEKYYEHEDFREYLEEYGRLEEYGKFPEAIKSPDGETLCRSCSKHGNRLRMCCLCGKTYKQKNTVRHSIQKNLFFCRDERCSDFRVFSLVYRHRGYLFTSNETGLIEPKSIIKYLKGVQKWKKYKEQRAACGMHYLTR